MAVAELFALIWDFVYRPQCKSKAKLQNKTVVITGGSSGIGKETALDLAARGAKVIIGSRDIEKGKRAAKDICRQVPKANIVVNQLDLASFASIRQFVSEILESEPRIHILINNAGIMGCPEAKTKDGFEMQMGVNHLGHFLLTKLLLDRLKESAPARIINVSSMAYTLGFISLRKTDMDHGYCVLQAYGNSKLANILFTRHLAKRLQGTSVTTYCLNPGNIQMEISMKCKSIVDLITKSVLCVLNKLLFKTPKQGAQTTIYCAVDENLAKESGFFYMGCRSVRPLTKARDVAFAKTFWEFSERLIEFASNRS